MTDLKRYLNSIYDKCVGGIFLSGRSGYWSNLTQEHNKKFLEILENKDCKSAVNLLCLSLGNDLFLKKRSSFRTF